MTATISHSPLRRDALNARSIQVSGRGEEADGDQRRARQNPVIEPLAVLAAVR